MKKMLNHVAKFCIAILILTPCLKCDAQGRTTKRLTSFCGFKVGEKKQNIKVPKSRDVPEGVRVRTPFRKFRDARLRFSDDDRLVGVDAATFIQGMKPSGGKAELDKCCSELAKYGIVFPDEWSDQGDGHIQKVGSGPGVSLIHIQGNLQASRYDEKSDKEKKGVILTIDLSWGDMYSPKVGNYTAKSNLTRREFVENVFGVKFGEEIPAGVRNVSKYNDNRLVTVELAQPICGIGYVAFYSEDGKKLSSIDFNKDIAARRIKDAEPEYDRLCKEVKTWLEIDSFETKDTSDNFMTKEGKTLPMYSGRVSSFEDGNIRVEVKMFVWSAESGKMPGGAKGTSLCATIELPMDGQPKRGNRVTRVNASNIPKVGNGERSTKEVEKLMKAIILPQCEFRPPDTIIDVVDFMNKKARELDPRNVPDNQRGIRFALTFPPEKKKVAIPDFCEENISLWNALKILCKNAKPAYKFEISNDGSGVVVVKPLSTPSTE